MSSVIQKKGKRLLIRMIIKKPWNQRELHLALSKRILLMN